MENERDGDEIRALQQVVSAYYHYKEYALAEYWKPRVVRWNSLTEAQKKMVPWYAGYLEELNSCIETNSQFFRSVAMQAVSDWGCDPNPDNWYKPSCMDMDKTISMFTQLVREWSGECVEERKSLMERLLPFLNKSFSADLRPQTKILVPGAGLARLVVDLVKEGFQVQGNEMSYHMLLLSRYILNGGISKAGVTVYPFVHAFSHHLTRSSQLRSVSLPDVNIFSEIKDNSLMSMSAGSFVDLYGPNMGIQVSGYYSVSPEMRLFRADVGSTVDVVVTSFFIDTGFNILDYLETINHVLRKGGYWINFGPLMYHFENDQQLETMSNYDPFTGEITRVDYKVPVKGLELSRDDILDVATQKFDFEILQNDTNIECGYGRNPKSMSMLGYMCNFWVLQKR